MADLKTVKNEALATINSALTILDNYPMLDESSTLASVNLSSNPFSFLLDLLKTTKGYDYMVQLIAGFIGGYLPVLESTVKGILITNLKTMLSCSINPFITKELLLNGVVLELRRLDLINMLRWSPLNDKVGKFYYFGCEDKNLTMTELSNKRWNETVTARKEANPETYKDKNISPYESNKEDFNAFLYYVKNYAPDREVWGMKFKSGEKYEDKADRLNGGKKLKKRDGIVTLEYHERSGSLKNALGDSLGMQTPFNQCLHVFIGNTESKKQFQNEAYYRQLVKLEQEMHKLQEDMEQKQSSYRLAVELLSNQQRLYSEGKIKKDEYEAAKKTLSADVDRTKIAYDTAKRVWEEKCSEAAKQRAKINALPKAKPEDYRPLEQNYYYHHPLLEFNVDYVMSLHLFDPVVITSQILDCITGTLSVDLNLSYEQLLIKYEVEDMVKRIIESDDQVVSDCFFTFSNDDYDKMLNRAELVRAGLLTLDGRGIGDVRISTEDILSTLNTLSSNASKEEIQSVVAGSIHNLSSKIARTEGYEQSDRINANLRLNIIENILNSLAYSITMQILSPKIYLIMAINLKILGQEAGFSLSGFIERNRQMVVAILRAVRDAILDYIVRELMKVVGDLASQVAAKLTIEQVMYYRRLIKRLIDCFRSGRNGLDFSIDAIEHADIIEQTEEPKNSEC